MLVQLHYSKIVDTCQVEFNYLLFRRKSADRVLKKSAYCGIIESRLL